MFTFLKQGLSNIQQTGSLVGSSVHLSRRMTSVINFCQPLHIVELGAGTGAITRHILSVMNRQTSLTAFEINPVLFGKLSRLEDHRLTKVNENVLQLPEYVYDRSVDYIISGLPLANINTRQKLNIIKTCKRVLKPGGYYIQFQYSLNDISLLKSNFSSVKYGFTLLNIPPAFVYYAKN
jgi:phospholipid N-methyltransferase